MDCGDAGGSKGGGGAYGWMIACEYYPPGNVETQYKAQVQREIKGTKGSSGAARGGGGGGGIAAMVLVLVTMAGVMRLGDWLWW